jgi:acetyl esterase/lipase
MIGWIILAFSLAGLIYQPYRRGALRQYIPDHSKRKSPHAAPLLATLDQLTGLPRTLIITAENDVLRDEAKHMVAG